MIKTSQEICLPRTFTFIMNQFQCMLHTITSSTYSYNGQHQRHLFCSTDSVADTKHWAQRNILGLAAESVVSNKPTFQNSWFSRPPKRRVIWTTWCGCQIDQALFNFVVAKASRHIYIYCTQSSKHHGWINDYNKLVTFTHCSTVHGDCKTHVIWHTTVPLAHF